jgi:hypothetical protein
VKTIYVENGCAIGFSRTLCAGQEFSPSGILGTRLHFFFIITHPAAMRKENQEKFSKNLWVLYAPDVTAAQGLPAAPSEPWSRSRKQTAARNEQYSSSYSPN